MMGTKKVLAVVVVLALACAFCLPALSRADEVIKGKIEKVDKDARKIVIDGKEYSMTDDASQVDVAAGDEVEATVDGDAVKALKK